VISVYYFVGELNGNYQFETGEKDDAVSFLELQKGSPLAATNVITYGRNSPLKVSGDF
jgi:hypothetical protein